MAQTIANMLQGVKLVREFSTCEVKAAERLKYQMHPFIEGHGLSSIPKYVFRAL